MAAKKTINFKVFLVDFKDVRAPSGYNQQFIEELIFGSSPTRISPSPDRAKYAGSAQQYFHASSDFWLSLKGNVTRWASSDLRNRDIPHWHGGMVKPDDSSGQTDYGESWPVIVAETLINLGFTSNNYSSATQLREDILKLSGRGKAERLVFLHTDVAGGGVKREFSQLKAQLDRMSDDKVRYNKIPGTNRKWNTLWDPAWATLPMFLVTTILTARQSSSQRSNNGTYAGPNPQSNTLVMAALSVIWHEFGHLAVDVERKSAINVNRLPDFYGAKYGPWGRMCLMGGPKANTHFPMPLSSLARWMAGWLDYRDYSRSNHKLKIRPFESHNDAIRLTNGAPGTKHYLCMTNRDELDYPDRSTPPISKGRGILAYRLDLGGRRMRVERNNSVVRKISSIVRRDSGFNNMIWKPETSIGALPPSGGFFKGPRTLRNERGELWWTLDEIKEEHTDLNIELRLKALHLLEDYHYAQWTGEATRRTPVSLNLDEFQGEDGHVALQDKRMLVAGRGGKALYLHPRWQNNGSIRGVYDLSHMEDGPKRLYLKLGMPEEARGSNGTRLSFTSGYDNYQLNLSPGDYRELIIDFRNPDNELSILVNSKGATNKDWVYIIDGWLVPAAPRIYDFLANARQAAWRTGRGRLTFNRQGEPKGEVSLRGWMTLHTGKTHGTKILFTHPNWSDTGWIEGKYSSISVPRSGAMVRAHIGWHNGRRVTDNGVNISIKIMLDGNEIVLLDKANLQLYETNAGKDWEKNELMFIELPIPSNVWNKEVDFIFRVDTDGNAAQDWVAWTEIALTSA